MKLTASALMSSPAGSAHAQVAATFFLACLAAMELEGLRLEDI
jgi:hypothetical protein